MNAWSLVKYVAISADYLFVAAGAVGIICAWIGRWNLWKLVGTEEFSEEMMCRNEWADLCGTTSLTIGLVFFALFALFL